MAHQDGKVTDGVEPGASQASSTPTQAAKGGYEVAVCRTGRAVQITLTAGTDYASIELYDNLVDSLKKGALRFEMKVPPR